MAFDGHALEAVKKNQRPFVIPVKAGIQSLMDAGSESGMTDKKSDQEQMTGKHNKPRI